MSDTISQKKLRGVIVPRHDTAINWAKATKFVPRDGELIVFTADDVPSEEIFTSDAPIWTSYDDEGNLIACAYNNTTDFTCLGNTQNLTSATEVDGCMVDGTRVPYMNLDENGTYVDSGSFFNLTPSNKVRFKFGDGKTNVNLLPFVETGTQEYVDLSNYYTKAEIHDLISNIEGSDVNLDNYYTKDEVNEFAAIENITVSESVDDNENKQLWLSSPNKNTNMVLSDDGTINVDDARITAVGSPVDNSDAVNKAYLEEYVNNYDSVALMEVTKSDTGVLELNDVYAIQNNANITVENKNVTYSFYSKNFVDTKCCLKDWVENFYDTNYATSEEFRSCTLSEYPIEMIAQFNEDNGDLAGYEHLAALTGTGIFVCSFTALANNASINFNYSNYYIGDYASIFVHNLQVNATYKLIIQVEETYDEGSERYYNRIPRVYLLQLANNEDDSVLYVGGVEPDASGNIDSSLMMSPTTIIVSNSSDAFNNLITATYDTEYKVDQNYNEDSVIPQSGTAVAEALDSLVTVMKGSSIDDITAAGVTSKVVILYED